MIQPNDLALACGCVPASVRRLFPTPYPPPLYHMWRSPYIDFLLRQIVILFQYLALCETGARADSKVYTAWMSTRNVASR